MSKPLRLGTYEGVEVTISAKSVGLLAQGKAVTHIMPNGMLTVTPKRDPKTGNMEALILIFTGRVEEVPQAGT